MGVNERAAIVTQLQAYAAQIDDIAEQTEWNGTKLIDGTTSTLSFQTGAGETDVTDVDGLGNLSATGTGSLAIAKDDRSADLISASHTGFTSVTTAAVTDPAELASGNYSIKITYGASGANSTVALLDSSGAEVDSVSSVNLGIAATVDFGNGLSATLAANASAAANDTVSTEVAYNRAGDYAIKFTAEGDSTDTYLTKNSSAADFRSYMSYVGKKLDVVSGQLSKIGALTGRLTFKEDQVSAAQINVEAAYNRIMNANMAEEQVNASKFQILQQTATAMLAQANAAPQFLLSLFQ
jgi:flagellin